MKIRVESLILAMLAVFTCYGQQSNIESAFEKIEKSKYIYSSESTSCTNDDDNSKTSVLKIRRFRIPVSNANLIENTTNAFEKATGATFLAQKNEDSRESYQISIDSRNSIRIGGEGMNLYVASFSDDADDSYRKAYAIEWKNANGDTIEGKMVYAYSPKPQSSSDDLNSTLNNAMRVLNDAQSKMNSMNTYVFSGSLSSMDSSSWLSKFVFYCEGIEDSVDSSSILTAYAKSLCKLTQDCSMLEDYEIELALEQLRSLIGELSKSKVSIVVQGLLKKAENNLIEAKE